MTFSSITVLGFLARIIGYSVQRPKFRDKIHHHQQSKYIKRRHLQNATCTPTKSIGNKLALDFNAIIWLLKKAYCNSARNRYRVQLHFIESDGLICAPLCCKASRSCCSFTENPKRLHVVISKLLSQKPYFFL